MTSNEIVRVYPIRTSRKEWNIPLYCYHICNQMCSQIYIIDQSDIDNSSYILVDNPEYINGKCQQSNKLEKTYIRLYSFDIDNPLGITGPLYNPNMIVIPDKSFSLKI